MSDVTQILCQIEAGDPRAAERLLPLVYDELRRLAAARMTRESPDHSLQPTELVHEAYLRLVDTSHPQDWKHRGHFFGAAAEAMRRILVERARRRSTAKRGGHAVRQPFHEDHVSASEDVSEVLAIHDLIDQLAASDRETAEFVKLRYFVGFTVAEVAEALGISERKAHYIWAYARSWLHQRLASDSHP